MFRNTVPAHASAIWNPDIIKNKGGGWGNNWRPNNNWGEGRDGWDDNDWNSRGRSGGK